jgi:hypothetical protein
MRISTLMLAALMGVAGAAAANPAAAETTVARAQIMPAAAIAGTSATPSTPAAEQYRSRRGGYRGGYRGGGRRHGYGGGYRRYGYGYRRGWRGSRVVCRRTWRYGRPIRRCFRVY